MFNFAPLCRNLQSLIDQKRRAGIVLGIVHQDETILLEAYGHSNLALSTPMETDALFRIFSMTRPISSVAFLSLVDDGLIGLDDPVAQYLPEIGAVLVIDPKGGPPVPQNPTMTIRHLLTYTAGFGYAFDWAAPYEVRMDEIISPSRPTREGIGRLALQPLLNQPGESWHYGFAGDVLGVITEIVTGQSLDRVLQDRVLGPLDMADTGFWYPPEKLGRLARAYGPVADDNLADVSAVWEPLYGAYDRLLAFLSAGGGLCATAEDYLRFCRMLLNGGILENARVLQLDSARMMLSPQLTGPQSATFWYAPQASAIFRDRPWSFGMAAASPDDTAPFHTQVAGWAGLMNTAFLIDPRRQLAAVAMSQYLGPDEAALSDILYEGVAAAAEK
jgi:CubicO group peptidase (beta-lactamase class C family)